MKVKIQVVGDDGTVLVEHEGDPMQPTQKKSFEKPFCEDKDYRLFGFVYQPLVQIKRDTEVFRTALPVETAYGVLSK